MTTAYPLLNISAWVANDGTNATITLSFQGRDDCAFSVSFEGASTLSAQINHLCQTMTQKLVESGEASERTKSASEKIPFRVLSVQRAHMDQDVLLSFQTQEGPMIELLIPDEIAGPLLSNDDGPLPSSRELQ